MATTRDTVELAYRAELGDLTSQLSRLPGISDKEARKMVASLDRNIKKAERASKAAAKASRQAWSNVGQGFLSAIPGAGQFTGAVDLARNALTGLGGEAAALAGPVAAFGAAMAVAAGASLAIADSTSAYVDKIGLAAAKTGLATDTIIALEAALKAGGSSFLESQMGLASFVKRASDAATKGGEAAASFERLGVSVADSSGNLRSSDEVLRETLDAIGALPTDTEKAAAALDLFGTRGGAIVAALGASSDSLDRWSATAREAGLVMDDELAAGSAAMDAAWARLDISTRAVTNTLGRDLMPVMADTIDTTAELVDKVNVAVQVLGAIKGRLEKLSPAYWEARAAAALFGDEEDDVNASTVALSGELERLADNTRDVGAAMDGVKAAEAFAAIQNEVMLAATGATDAEIELAQRIDEIDAKTAAYITTLKEQREVSADEEAALLASAEAAKAKARADAEAEQASKDAAAAARLSAAAERDRAAAAREAEQDERALLTALGELAGVSAAANADRLTELERIAVAYSEQIARVRELASEQATSAEAQALAAAAEYDLEQRKQRDITSLLSEAEAERAEIRAAAVSAQREASAAEVAAWQDAAGQMVSSAGGVLSAYAEADAQRAASRASAVAASEDASSAEVQAAQDAAVKAFHVSQAAATGEAVMNTAVAVTKAATSAPPPFNAPAILSAGALGAAQLAMIAKQSPPSFHAGGVPGPSTALAPDEQFMRTRGVEGVVNSRGMAALDRINRGDVGGPQQITVVNQYRHEVFDRFVSDNLERRESPLAAAVRGLDRVGHLET